MSEQILYSIYRLLYSFWRDFCLVPDIDISPFFLIFSWLPAQVFLSIEDEMNKS